VKPTFRECFDTHGAGLLRYLRRLTGSRSDAEELLQDTFLKLHLQFEEGIDLENVRAWLFHVATNAARDRERERRVRLRESGQVPGGNVVDFETRLARQHLTRQALRRLTPRMRRVLLLWAEGFSYREIASVADIEPGYVGVLVQRARSAFKKTFEQGESADRARRTRDGLL
jgi:RNA polymerase sigma-70 factor, ECF subfamily